MSDGFGSAEFANFLKEVQERELGHRLAFADLCLGLMVLLLEKGVVTKAELQKAVCIFAEAARAAKLPERVTEARGAILEGVLHALEDGPETPSAKSRKNFGVVDGGRCS
jgi:cell division protein FtsB